MTFQTRRMNLSSSAQVGVRAAIGEREGTALPTPQKPAYEQGDDEESVAAFRYPEASREAQGSWGAGGLDAGGAAGEQSRARAAAVQEGEERARAWYAGELEREARADDPHADDFHLLRAEAEWARIVSALMK